MVLIRGSLLFSTKRGLFIRKLRCYSTEKNASLKDKSQFLDNFHVFDKLPLLPTSLKLDPPELDIKYLCDRNNLHEISENVKRRKAEANPERLSEIAEQIDKNLSGNKNWDQINSLRADLLNEALKIPNKTHPSSNLITDDFQIIKLIGEKPTFSFKPKEFSDIGKKLGLLRTENLGNLTGTRTYYLKGALAQLEQALIKFTLQNLFKKGFELVSVPDILHPDVLECCGMKTDDNQVFTLDPLFYSPLCLSGTSEMALAALHLNNIIPVESLPRKIMAVSRCHRAEVSHNREERGIYRVHQFTKVEMFAVSANETGDESQNLLDEFLEIQEELFSSLGLHLQLLEMAPSELGNSAYRKFDWEAWMPGRKMFGEISSASNCTDYQSRRLGIEYLNSQGHCKHVHTVNGTACAIPRMLTSLIETHQQKNNFLIPKPLQDFMNGLSVVDASSKVDMQWIKTKAHI